MIKEIFVMDYGDSDYEYHDIYHKDIGNDDDDDQDQDHDNGYNDHDNGYNDHDEYDEYDDTCWWQP